MKRLLTLLLFMCLAAAALAQAKPDYQNTRMPQVWSNWSGRFNKSFALPSGAAPLFPIWVPDTSKRGSLFNKTGGTHDRLQHYDAVTGTWLGVAYDAEVLHLTDLINLLYTKARVDSAIAAHEVNDLYDSASTSGVDTYTSATLHGVLITSVTRSGMDYQPTANLTPGSNEYHYDGNAGSIKFGDGFLTTVAEKLHFKYKAAAGSGGSGIIATYPTFAAIAFPLTKQGIIEISADETRGGRYVLYAVGSGGAASATNLHFIASTQSNNP